ncbi:MAG: aldehyde dehydrogenase family protein [Candidatus Omnitrophota bacterium]
MRRFSLFINGQFKDSGNWSKIINPSTGDLIAEVAVAGEREIYSSIDAARKAFDEGPWRTISLEERKNFLLKISQAILENAAELANLETLNTGKPIKESTFMDIPSAAKTFEYFANNLENFLVENTLKLDSQAEGGLIREPLGVAVLIVPWNYPLLIASWKLAAALAAGNTVILKPSSLTPLSVFELAKIIDKIGMPKGAVNIINASGERIGKALCSDKRVDLVSFTGSNEVGKEIISSSANQVKKLIMELGGKSASIIFKDADLEAAVNGSLCSIFLNQGQMCTAMSRIFVEDALYDKFRFEFSEKAKRIKLGEGLDHETQMGPLISNEQRKKVLDYVNKAKADGAKLLWGGEIPKDAKLKKGFFFEPTIFEEVTPEMAIFKQEVFGPVVTLGKFSDQEEAVRLADSTDFGLALCIWTKDISKAKELAGKIDAGIVWINTYGMFYNELPYGGFKQSGFGKELGREGFLEYTRLKTLVTDKSKDSKPLVNYWYGL